MTNFNLHVRYVYVNFKFNICMYLPGIQDISPEKEHDPPTVNDIILTWVSYIGACVCIVCLLVTIVMTVRTK